MKILSELKYDSDGLVAAVIQDRTNNEVLMVGYMNAEAIKRHWLRGVSASGAVPAKNSG